MKRLVLLVALSAALLTSSMVLASPIPSNDQAFLASLQAPAAPAAEAPALPGADLTPAPMPAACTFYGCVGCSVNGMVGVHYCYNCNGVQTCGPCSYTCKF